MQTSREEIEKAILFGVEIGSLCSYFDHLNALLESDTFSGGSIRHLVGENSQFVEQKRRALELEETAKRDYPDIQSVEQID